MTRRARHYVRVGILVAFLASLAIAGSVSELGFTTPALAAGPVVHHVSVGGPDNIDWWCHDEDRPPHPGCDGNFSLEVNEYADGTVRGQFTDQMAQGDGGVRAVIDCLAIEGNTAWVSGTIVKGGVPAWGPDWEDWTGWDFATVVRDNGKSANDPPDQIAWSLYQGPPSPPCSEWGPPGCGDTWAPSCTEKADWMLQILTDMPKGQVKIK